MESQPNRAPASWARRQALKALCSWSGNERRVQLRPFITSVADRAREGQRDKNLFWELVLGVVRSCRLLDAVLKVGLRKGLPGPGETRQALRIGLYQLLYLDRIPVSAAVDQSVRLVANKKARSLVNAVLRRAAEALREHGEVLDPTRQLALPGGRLLDLPEPFLPDPAQREVAYLAVLYSFPDLLVRRWLRRWGREQAERLLAAGNTNPPLNLRVNPLRTDPGRVTELLQAEGVLEIRPGPRPGTLQVEWPGNPAGLRVLQEGLVTVQDQAAMRAVELLDPQPGERILDLCAAPGGKTTQIAERMGDQGEVLAWDAEPRRLGRVDHAVERLGLQSIRVLSGLSLGEVLALGPFDRILVDAPCSGTGILARRPEGRWKLKSEDFLKLPALQRRILGQVLPALGPGGVVVYSTCSLEPEENEQVATGMPGWTAARMETTLPEAGVQDGSFAACLQLSGDRSVI